MKNRAKKGLTRRRILRVLRENRPLLDGYSVKKIGLFGSYAKGRPNERSDIDFLVEFAQPTFDNFIGLSRGLEKLFGRRVEILTPEALASVRVRGIADSIRKSLAYA
jgi:hypothetical protein